MGDHFVVFCLREKFIWKGNIPSSLANWESTSARASAGQAS
jgi:hypothetical protein